MLNFKKMTLIALMSSLSLNAFAGEPGVTAGLKFGSLSVDFDGADSGNAKGFSLGYDMGGTFSVELEVLSGEADGEVAGVDLDGDIDTTALYGVYRSEGKGYFLLKAGLLSEKVKACGFGFCASESDTGLSVGLGGGLRLNDNFSLEAEYTLIESDVKMLGLGARFKF